MAFKIYTKTGDAGETGLFGGKRLPKSHLRIDAYGTVDELNSQIGLLHAQLDLLAVRSDLEEIQKRLFDIGSNLAADPDKEMPVPQLQDSDIVFLESAIDAMDEDLAPLKTFILPGGHPWAAQAHVVRCVCRRAERLVVALHQVAPVNDILLRYLNRLSDYFFTLARFLNHLKEGQEIPWVARKEEQ